jgi:amidase
MACARDATPHHRIMQKPSAAITAAAPLSRRAFLGAGAAAGALALVTDAAVAAATGHAPDRPHDRVAPFELDELTVADLQAGMQSGRWTARALTERYLARIAEIDAAGPSLRSVIEVNPDALAIADAMDAERRAGKVRGPLHGIPMLVKDNVATADRMETTAGSLALVGSEVPRDAFIVTRLRDAGAVLLGKTNLSEWANFRSTRSSSGWSGRGGQTRNPYALDRSPSGSSSGSGAAIAASLAAIAVGTETDGSITSPAAASALVGIKPTVGLVSRSGIVPISHTQDTAGPMTRTVRDAAILLGVLAGVDSRDAATAASRGKAHADYTQFLREDGLEGARIGVARKAYMGYHWPTDAMTEEAIALLKAQGAIIVDPADIATAGRFDGPEFEVLLHEFKADLNAYLAELVSSPVRTLADVMKFNEAYQDKEMPYFRQELMEMAQKKGTLTSAAYVKAKSGARRLAGALGIDATMTKHRLDALIAPTQAPSWPIDLVTGDHWLGSFSTPAAVAGYPHVTVPMGQAWGLPVGLSFVGRAWSEPVLLKLAYAYEQAAKARKAPEFRGTVVMS